MVECLYGPVLSLAMLSILLQYKRVFMPGRLNNKLLHYSIHTLMWAVVLYGVVATVLTIVTCIPVAKTWDPFVDGRCLSGAIVVSVAVYAFRILLEICILLVPIPTIWKLQMSRKRRIAVNMLFGGGALCVPQLARFLMRIFAYRDCRTCAMSIVRMVATIKLYKTVDNTYALQNVGVWR